MATVNKKLEYIRLEKYLTNHFHFSLNEITGNIEFKKKAELQWEELNEFNIYRQLRLEGFKCNLNELIYYDFFLTTGEIEMALKKQTDGRLKFQTTN